MAQFHIRDKQTNKIFMMVTNYGSPSCLNVRCQVKDCPSRMKILPISSIRIVGEGLVRKSMKVNFKLNESFVVESYELQSAHGRHNCDVKDTISEDNIILSIIIILLFFYQLLFYQNSKPIFIISTKQKVSM